MEFMEKIILALLIIGLADALYLMLVQAGAAPLYCSISNIINCQRVETSTYSNVFGMQIAYGGVVWFVAAIVLFFGRRSAKLRTASRMWYVLGIGAAAYSLLSQYAIGSICEYCLGLDVILLCLGAIAIIEA